MQLSTVERTFRRIQTATLPPPPKDIPSIGPLFDDPNVNRTYDQTLHKDIVEKNTFYRTTYFCEKKFAYSVFAHNESSSWFRKIMKLSSEKLWWMRRLKWCHGYLHNFWWFILRRLTNKYVKKVMIFENIHCFFTESYRLLVSHMFFHFVVCLHMFVIFTFNCSSA